MHTEHKLNMFTNGIVNVERNYCTIICAVYEYKLFHLEVTVKLSFELYLFNFKI